MGKWEDMVVILIIALIVFGPKKLPDIGKSLGKGIAEFKKASSELAKSWDQEVEVEKKSAERPAEKTENQI